MIALVDCNNFFASCERLFRPDLKNKPVLVLSNNDGCVVARSNEVRQLGIPMAVPYFKIKEIVEENNVRCFSSNFPLYSNISQRILSVLEQHAPEVEVYSIDEAFLDLTSLGITDYAAWGNELRDIIQRTTGMPVSVGIAPTKTLAKLASHHAKTTQTTCVLDPSKDPATYEAVLSKTPAHDVWGIGRRLAPRLQSAGVRTAWQITQVKETWLRTLLGVNGSRLWHELRGTSMHPFETIRSPQKSLMVSRSFGHTISTYHELEVAVATFASQAAFKLRKYRQTTRLFGVYLRFRAEEGKPASISAVASLHVGSNDTAVLVTAALQSLAKLYSSEVGYVKAGVFSYHLESANHVQHSILQPTDPKKSQQRQRLMTALDNINQRFGNNTLYLGVLDSNAKQWQARKERMSPAYTTSWTQLPQVHRPR